MEVEAEFTTFEGLMEKASEVIKMKLIYIQLSCYKLFVHLQMIEFNIF